MGRTRSMFSELLEDRQLLTTAIESLPSFVRGADLSSFSSSQGTAYFSLHSQSLGNEVWQSDGTSEGTHVVTDLLPGALSSHPTSIVNAGGRVFFMANGQVEGADAVAFHLWTSNGDGAATALLTSDDAWPDSLTPHGDQLAFVDLQTNELWTSDGTTEGTQSRSGPITPQLEGRHDRWKLSSAQEGIFITSEGDTRLRRWNNDSSIAVLGDFSNGGEFSQVDVHQTGGSTWLRAFGVESSQLWKLDATGGSFELVHHWRTSHISWNDASSFDGQLLFTVAEQPGPQYAWKPRDFEFTSRQLWITDGTEAGTRRLTLPVDGMIAAANIGPAGISYIQLDSDGNYDLWHTPNAHQLPQQVYNFDRLVRHFDNSLAPLQSSIYFVDGADVAGQQSTLYRFDVAAEKPRAIHTFAGGIISGLQTTGDRLLFTADDGSGAAIWTSDGTTAGTASLQPFAAVSSSMQINQLLNVGDQLMFTTPAAFSRLNLYTDMLWTRNPNGDVRAIAEVMPYQTEFARNKAELDASHPSRDVWTTDGTRAGTAFERYGQRPVFRTPYIPNREPGAPSVLFGSSPVTIGNTTYSVRSTVTHGAELWATVGSESRLVKDILPGPFSSSPRDMVVINDIVYFSARDRTTLFNIGGIEEEHEENWELWRSDGTEAGTYKFLEINEEPEAWPFFTSSSHVRDFIPIERGFLFNAKFDGALNGGALGTGRGWFSSDGTPDGTFRLEELDDLNELFTFPNQIIMYGKNGIWSTDGTQDGTSQVWEFSTVGLVRTSEVSQTDGGAFVSVADDAGVRVFFTDGTATGTRLVTAIPDVHSIRQAGRVLDDANFDHLGDFTYFRVSDFDETELQLWLATADDARSIQSFPGASSVSVSGATPNMGYSVRNSKTAYDYQDGDYLVSVSYRGEGRDRTREYWIYNQNSPQTYQVERFDARGFGTRELILADGLGYFVLEDEEFGRELWVTDGTQNGTHVYDFVPGTDSSNPSLLTEVDGELLLLAYLDTDEDPTTPLERTLLKIGGERELRGDVNGDASVDFADFLKLSANFGKQNVPREAGDLNGDGSVTFADFLILSGNYGSKQVASQLGEPIQRNLENVELFFALFSVGQ